MFAHKTLYTSTTPDKREILPAASLEPEVPPAKDDAEMMPVDVTRPGTAAPG